VPSADRPDLTLFLDIVHTLEADPMLTDTFDEAYLDAQAQALGPDVEELWQAIKQAAQDEARREDTQNPVAA
jgi:hypothetical protein